MNPVETVQAPHEGVRVEQVPHAPEAEAQQPLFSEEQWQMFHSEDTKAGGFIVAILMGIFSLALLMYLAILWTVLS